MPADNRMRFACSLVFRDAWKATPREIDQLVSTMISSFAKDAVTGLSFHGDISDGTLDVHFDAPTTSEGDTLACIDLVVRALNAGRVDAPGWPNSEVIDHAIASVSVRESAFAA